MIVENALVTIRPGSEAQFEAAFPKDLTVGFRGSPAVAEWRGLIGPFFESSPVVEHFRALTGQH